MTDYTQFLNNLSIEELISLKENLDMCYDDRRRKAVEEVKMEYFKNKRNSVYKVRLEWQNHKLECTVSKRYSKAKYELYRLEPYKNGFKRSEQIKNIGPVISFTHLREKIRFGKIDL